MREQLQLMCVNKVKQVEAMGNLMYRAYAFNRKKLTAEQARLLNFPMTEKLEELYQQEISQ